MSSGAHPDTIGAHDAATLAREEARRTADLADLPDPEEDVERDYNAAVDELEWAQWPRQGQHAHRGCGHPCESGACFSMAGKNDPLCLDCQLSEVSDGERHRARGKVAS